MQLYWKLMQSEGQPQLEQKAKREQEKKPPEVVVAIYDFRGAEQGDLSLLKVTVPLYAYLRFFRFKCNHIYTF